MHTSELSTNELVRLFAYFVHIEDKTMNNFVNAIIRELQSRGFELSDETIYDVVEYSGDYNGGETGYFYIPSEFNFQEV